MSALVSDAARSLVTASAGDRSRVLVTGASGWFGRTAIDLLSETGAALLCTASRVREIEVSGRRIILDIWDEEAVRDFHPNIVIDCAFLTRDRLSEDRRDDYVRVNRSLTAQLLSTAAMPSVEMIVTVSSGAAVYPRDALTLPFDENPYGHLKREAEQSLLEAALGRGINAVVARAWAVSGAHVQFPRTFALSDMILQAANASSIDITATIEVWRRYTAVDELLAVALATAAKRTSVIESGGPLVEMDGLAEAVRLVVNPDVDIRRPPLGDGAPNRYHNDGLNWRAACAEFDLTPKDLHEQIAQTYRGLVLSDNGLPRV